MRSVHPAVSKLMDRDRNWADLVLVKAVLRMKADFVLLQVSVGEHVVKGCSVPSKPESESSGRSTQEGEGSCVL